MCIVQIQLASIFSMLVRHRPAATFPMRFESYKMDKSLLFLYVPLPGRIMSLRKQTPSDFLKQIIGRPVVVKLNSGVDYRGVLACLDGYMNIAVEQTEEYVNGQLKNKYGDAFLRGNNVLYISTQKRKM
uniref:U6 snRNA-associated Sm-like protein LSm6 n=1 Tax=Hucho hucho TaxID=62062 RepID=A0A4W5LXZ3_9TELE